ncbi:MAG: AraC family transcriptional regulator [Xanthobacteraceae bacterium]|nr:AraC family transcriptional regulator [Xanthobacteraceae bacterium]
MRAYLRQGFGNDVQFDVRSKRDRAIDVRSEGVDLPNMVIHHTRLTAGFTIEGRAPDPHYVMFLPLGGRIEASSYGSNAVCDLRRAFILCRPSKPAAVLRTEAPISALSLRFSKAAMSRQLGALIGEPVDAAPEFALAMNLTAGYGRLFASYLLLAVADFKRATPSNPIAIHGLEEFIISQLLMSHPHNFSAALRRTDRPIAPRDMKRAIDFMQAMIDAPIGIAEIADAAGIAGRTLFKHFHDVYGTSPMRYLRNARFEKVRDALRRAEPQQSVTEIAMAWGFHHMGRFSVEYRSRFGERPSDTLKRAR